MVVTFSPFLSFPMQWSYATAFDWFLIVIAIITAIIHGGALPAFAIVFGDFIDLFINQARTQAIGFQVARDIGLTTGLELDVPGLVCNDPDPFNIPAIMDSLPLPINLVFAATGGSEPQTVTIFINVTSTWTTVFQDLRSECLDEDGFIRGINTFVYVFVGIAVGVFTFAYLEISLFQTACERQVKKIRLAFYQAIVRQEVGWFDANPSGELTSRIAE